MTALRVTSERHTTTDTGPRGWRCIGASAIMRLELSRVAKRCLRFEFSATTFVAVDWNRPDSAVGLRLILGIDRFDIVIVPWGYEILNGVESNSCAGIEAASAVLLGALRATPHEASGATWSVESQNSHPVSQRTRDKDGAPFLLNVFQPTG